MKEKPKLKKLPPFDADGARIRVGDTVKVLDIPAFDGPDADALHAVFSHILGKTLRVSAFDEYGALELAFQVHKARKYLPEGLHCVSLEPWFTKLKAK